MFQEDYSAQAPLIQSNNSPFEVQDPTSGYLPHPIVTLCHVAFRGAAFFFFIMSSLFSDSFIFSFVITILLLSVDFWVVKNVTGRIMVGLRWWNYIDDNGVSHWVYESLKENERHLINPTESKIFWLGLFVFPLLWSLMFVAELFSFKFKWLVLVIIALTLNASNVFGYLRCKFGKNDKSIHEAITSVATNYITGEMVQNVISSSMGPRQQNQNPNPNQQHNFV